MNFSISLYQREACVAATGVSGVAVPAARWHEKERRHRCERRRHRRRRKLDSPRPGSCLPLPLRCNRREDGSWLTQWETRPPGKYPLMPAKLPHSRTSLCPCSRGIFIPLFLYLRPLLLPFHPLKSFYTFLFLCPLSVPSTALYTLCYTVPFAFSPIYLVFYLSPSIRNGSVYKYLESSLIN